MKGVIQLCNRTMASYTIIVHAELIPAYIQKQQSPPTVIKTKSKTQGICFSIHDGRYFGVSSYAYFKGCWVGISHQFHLI